jgi:hypothetical protein
MCYCSVSGSISALFLLIITSAYSSPSLFLQTKFHERRCLIVLIRRSFQHQPLKNNNIIIRGEHFFQGRERERERGVGNNAWLGRGKREREKNHRRCVIVASQNCELSCSRRPLFLAEVFKCTRSFSNGCACRCRYRRTAAAARDAVFSLLSNMKLLLVKDYVRTQTNKRAPRAYTDEVHKHFKKSAQHYTKFSMCITHEEDISISLPPRCFQ